MPPKPSSPRPARKSKTAETNPQTGSVGRIAFLDAYAFCEPDVTGSSLSLSLAKARALPIGLSRVLVSDIERGGQAAETKPASWELL